MLDVLKKIFKDGLSAKAKILIAVSLIVFVIIGALVGYQVYDYTQNNPKFCVSCHLMDSAFTAWENSVHKEINCHDCHHLSVPEMNSLMYSFVVHRPDEVPERHGKVIVPWKYCVKCHWEGDDRYTEAPMINDSKIHAKHYFSEKVECSRCHGYKAHEFVPEERFCTQCHTEKEVHGKGMDKLACLNCHIDDRANLRPDRDKCLFCHGDDKVRERVLTEHGDRTDVSHFQPSAVLINSAIKIKLKPDSPMQFDCYECHKPHEQVRPDWGNCLDCHRQIPNVGKHTLHITDMGMSCSDCHQPHLWTITKEQAKVTCVSCHDYKDPMDFIK